MSQVVAKYSNGQFKWALYMGSCHGRKERVFLDFTRQ